MDTTSPAAITAEIEVARLLGLDHAHLSALTDDPRRRLVWGIEQNHAILFSIDANGALNSQGRLPGAVRKARLAACDLDGIVYYLDEESWRIVGVDTADLSQRFSYKPDGSVLSLSCVPGGSVVIASARKDFLEVYCVDRLGKTLWSTPLPFEAASYIRFKVDAFLAGVRAPVLVEVQPMMVQLIGLDRTGQRRRTTDWVARNRKSTTLADSAGQRYHVQAKSVIDVSSGPVAQSVMMLYTTRVREDSERSIIYDWDAGSEPWPRALLPEFETYTSIARLGGTSICAVGGSRRSDGRAVIWLVRLAH
jgi:hypothetical protein